MMSVEDCPPVDIQIAVDAEGWPYEKPLAGFCARVIGASATFLEAEMRQPMPPAPPELSLLFTDDAAMRQINAEWREVDRPTNVLSFPAAPIRPGDMPGPMLGDIVMARETMVREAVELGRNFNDHLAHLLVHGYLHLFGYDHIDPNEAELMEFCETRILAALGISDPYGHTVPE